MILAAIGFALFLAALFVYIVIRYVPIIERNAFNIPRHQVPESHSPAAALRPVKVHIPDLEPFDAYYISKGKNPRCVVVFCHETGANWESWVKHAAFLPEEGIDVLAFDVDDRPVIYQWPSLEEAGRVSAAIEWASGHAPNVPIVLFGISKGSAIAAANDHAKVKGFILDGAFSTRLTLKRYIKKWAGIYVGSEVVARYIPGWLIGLLARMALHYARILKQRQFFSIETYIRHVRKPVLFIHAENDPFVRKEEIEVIRKSIPAATELWVAEGAGHSESVALLTILFSVSASASGFTFLSKVSSTIHTEEHVLTFTLIAGILTVIGMIYRSKLSSVGNAIIPDKGITFRNLVESFGEFIYNLCRSTMGEHEARKYFSCIATLFTFIFVSNLIGLIPGFLPPTDNINTTLALGVFVFIYYNYHGIKEQGIVGHIKHFMGPVWYLAFLIFPIELISHAVRPISLALRLRGNMFGDHLVLSIFSGMLPYVIPIAFLVLGLFVCLIQAFVFSLLTMVYISLATAHHDHDGHEAH